MTTPSVPSRVSKTFPCVAYGGASVACPPGHTVEAFRKAIEMGAGMLFAEVRVTRDGEMVVWPSMQRLVKDEGVYIADYTLAEWRTIAESDPESVPVTSLDELLELVAQTRCALAIDMHIQGLENALAKKLRKLGLPYDQLVVASASDVTRTVLRSLDPRILVAHRFELDIKAQVTSSLLSDLEADAVFWPSNVLTTPIVHVLRRLGKAIYGGPAHTAQEMRRLRDECKIDGVLTPYPDLFLSLSDQNYQAIQDIRAAA